MVLPKDFKLHENRLTQEALDSIIFQYERLDLDSTDTKVFLEKFLKISKSPSLPQEDTEIIYLASKVAYMLAAYDYFDKTTDRIEEHKGALVWKALAKAATGNINESIEILDNVLLNVSPSSDSMVYIECLGIFAQILLIKGIEAKGKFDEIIEKILKFKADYQDKIQDFDNMFLPSYLILERKNSLQLTNEEILESIKDLYQLTIDEKNSYFRLLVQLDYCNILIKNQKLDKSKKLIDDAIIDLNEFKFKALEAKTHRFLGVWYEVSGDLNLAEKTYLIAQKSYAKLKDQIGISACVLHLAQLYEKQDNREKAIEYYNQSFAISEKMQDCLNMTVSLTALARFAAKKGQFNEAYDNYNRVLHIAEENNFDQLLPMIYDGLSHINFMAGDFQTAIENQNKSLNYKHKFDYKLQEILIDHMKLGQLNAIIGEFQSAFSEFENALNICNKLNQKDEIYFDILNWLFDVSYALGKTSLAESYIGRADLFASIHNSKEENVQALISRIRFHIQKREFVSAQELLVNVFRQAQDFPSPLTMALALIEKAVVLMFEFIDNKSDEILAEILNTIDDMLFISLDLEFLPLTMYTKKVMGKILCYKEEFDDGIEELNEAIELANSLGMTKFEANLKIELKHLEEQKKVNGTISDEELAKTKLQYLNEAIDYLRETFWLVSASEYQK